MKATDMLEREHRMVLLVTGAAHHEARALAGGGGSLDDVERMLDFFRFFADACHDPKEEDILFTHVHKRGFSWEEAPLSDLCAQHTEIRKRLAIVHRMARAAKSGSTTLEELSDELGAFADLMEEHVTYENDVFFPMVDALFTDEDQQDLLDELEHIGDEECEEGMREMYAALAVELSTTCAG